MSELQDDKTQDKIVDDGTDGAGADAGQQKDQGTDTGAIGDDGKDDDEGVKTALDAGDGDDGDEKASSPTDWPDDWREKLANGNDDAAKLLNRFRSPKGLLDKILNQEKVIRSGKIKHDMPDLEDEEAMKAWRKEQGIPDDPTGYTIPDSVKSLVTDEDKPLLASFTEWAHEKNASQDTVDLATEWYFNTVDEINEKQAATDKEAADEAVDVLRQEHGRDYRPNMQLAKRFMETFGEDIGSSWTEARLPDGRRLGDIPEFVNQAVDHGRAMFGDVSFATPDGEAAHNNRKAEIEKIRDTDFARYEREGLDKELTEITEKELARDRRKQG